MKGNFSFIIHVFKGLFFLENLGFDEIIMVGELIRNYEREIERDLYNIKRVCEFKDYERERERERY